MSRSGFPIFAGQPLLRIENFTITGSGVSTGAAGTGGLDGRGANFCTISRSTDTYTVTFNVGYPDVPYLVFTPLTTDVAADNIRFTTTNGITTAFQFDAKTRDSNSTGVGSACAFQVAVFGYGTASFVS